MCGVWVAEMRACTYRLQHLLAQGQLVNQGCSRAPSSQILWSRGILRLAVAASIELTRPPWVWAWTAATQ